MSNILKKRIQKWGKYNNKKMRDNRKWRVLQNKKEKK